MTEPRSHLRPFFPAAQDFVAATTPHFSFLVDEFAFSDPTIVDHEGVAFDVRYDDTKTAVLLSWDLEGGYFACHLVPRLADGSLDPDFDHWLGPNEVLAVRGGTKDWVSHEDLDDIDEIGYARVMERVAANLRNYCTDLLRGDWSIFGAAHRWFKEQGAP